MAKYVLYMIFNKSPRHVTGKEKGSLAALLDIHLKTPFQFWKLIIQQQKNPMQITVRWLLIWQNSTMHLYVSQITCHFCRSERLFVSSNKFIDLLSIFWNFQYCSTLLNISRIFSGLCAWSNIFLQVRIFYNESQCYTNISAKLLKKISTQFTKIHYNTSVIFHRSLSIISIRKRKRKRRVFFNLFLSILTTTSADMQKSNLLIFKHPWFVIGV